MKRITFFNAELQEISDLLSGNKTMVIRCAARWNKPHKRIEAGDGLFFKHDGVDELAIVKAEALSVFYSEKLSREEVLNLILQHQDKLQITIEQLKWLAGKRFIMLIEVTNVESLPVFQPREQLSTPIADVKAHVRWTR